MAFNLSALQPNKVSKDLSSYTKYIYGKGGAGKTTFACTPENTLLLAFENGYKAIPGVIPVDIFSWKDARDVEKELRKPENKKLFTHIAIDTADIATQYLSKWVCNQNGISTLGEGGWTVNGWDQAKKEWERFLNSITMEGYGLTIISHEKERAITRKDGTSYTAIGPSLSSAFNEITRNKADIECYINLEEDGKRTLVLRSDGTIECKSRFKDISPVITFSYENLEKAMTEAIDNESKATDGKFVTEEKPNSNLPSLQSLKDEWNDLITELRKNPKFDSDISPKLTTILNENMAGQSLSDLNDESIPNFVNVVREVRNLL